MANELEYAMQRYKRTYLYLLIPAIFTHEPVDTMDIHLLKYSQAPLVSPLNKPMKIEMYNGMSLKPSKVSVNRDNKYEESNQVDS